MTVRDIRIKGEQLRFLGHADETEQLITGTATGETPTGWNLKVKGTYVYWVDDDGAERRKEGTVTGNTGVAGTIKVKGTEIYYIDDDGDERSFSASELKDYWNASQNGDAPIYNANMGGQTFTPSATYTLGSVKIYIKRTGTSCDTYTLALTATSGGKPSGANLAEIDFDADLISLTGEWKELDLPDYSVVGSTKYALVLSQKSTYVSGSFLDWFRESEATYAGGQACLYSSGAWGYLTSATTDFLFECWGS